MGAHFSIETGHGGGSWRAEFSEREAAFAADAGRSAAAAAREGWRAGALRRCAPPGRGACRVVAVCNKARARPRRAARGAQLPEEWWDGAQQKFGRYRAL